MNESLLKNFYFKSPVCSLNNELIKRTTQEYFQRFINFLLSFVISSDFFFVVSVFEKSIEEKRKRKEMCLQIISVDLSSQNLLAVDEIFSVDPNMSQKSKNWWFDD